MAAHGMPDPFDFHDGGRTAGSNFAAMTLHILGQQISTKVAFVLYDRLSAQTSGTPTPQAVLALGADPIRALGASRAKAAYLLNLAGHVGSGALDIEDMDDLSDQQATDALTQVKGIGAWSAQMFLIAPSAAATSCPPPTSASARPPGRCGHSATCPRPRP